MKFELTDYHRYSSDSKLIDDLKHVAEIIKKDTVTLDAVSYTHLDVYKRQAWSEPTPVT